MVNIVEVPIGDILSNPFRRLRDYPYDENKLTALMASISDIGFLVNVYARPQGDKHEIAYGHHRIEAGRRLELKTVPLVVDELSDLQMLQYMGRENLEDYNAQFLVQLETWEAAIKSGLLRASSAESNQAIEIASILGWNQLRDDKTLRLNGTARAANAAYALITAGYLDRDAFRGLSVNQARDLAERTWSRMEQIDKTGKAHAHTAAQIERAKRHYAKGADMTADQIRKGSVRPVAIRGAVDFNAMARMGKTKSSPLFAIAANAVADNLKNTLLNDADAGKLSQIIKALPMLSLLEDWQALRRIHSELEDLSERALHWKTRTTPTKDKIVKFKALERKQP